MQPAEKPHGYQGLSHDRPALQAAMRKAYDSLIDFVTTDAFKTLMEDLGALHPIHRPKFVFDVLLRSFQRFLKGGRLHLPDLLG